MKLRRRETGEEFELGPDHTVGRLPSCQIMLDDSSVSRRHARFAERSGSWYVTDLGSSNGTARNGERGSEFELRDGDLLTFGAVAFDVVAPRVVPQAAATPEVELLDEPSQGAPLVDDAPAARPARSAAAEQERARIRQELKDAKRSRGLGDLSQQPLWIQLVVLLVGAALVYAIVFGVRELMAMMSPAG